MLKTSELVPISELPAALRTTPRAIPQPPGGRSPSVEAATAEVSGRLAASATTPAPKPARAAPAPGPAVVGDLVVLKFGSSVLADRAAVPEAVTEIYRLVRDGKRVLAVVSAVGGVTDRLLAEARELGCAHDNLHLPRYVALGEETTAALLTLACDRAGLSTATLTVAELGLKAEGDWESAEPTGLDPAPIERAFQGHDVVVVPGYGAVNAEGQVVLLGRGGSDLSAVYLAAELKASRVRLVKDVDGVYDRDPHGGDAALRFGAISWSEARAVAGVLVQPRALDFAETRGLTVEVGALGREDATRIGRVGAPPAARQPLKRLRVALAGCGVVGGGVLQRLRRRPEEFEVVSVLVRDLTRTRPGIEQGDEFTADEAAFLSSGVDVMVDLLSSAEAGARLGELALERGAHVVSANKQAVVLAHARLLRASAKGGGDLLYSAAVGGGAPLVETVRRARAEGQVTVIEGVLNGTVNFVLERLFAGDSLEGALRAARAAGLAEEDPTADLAGLDAAAKLQILAYEAFGERLDSGAIARQTLDAAVAQAASGARLRQLSRVVRTAKGLQASVTFVSGSPYDDLRADRNALRVTGADGRVFLARGRGAGRWPTAESVFADLVDLHAAGV